MLGFEAISANNGWEYALVGVCIVFSGLVLLSIVISQLHKLLTFWEKRASVMQTLKLRWQKNPASFELSPPSPPATLTETMRQYKMIVDRIGEPFSLPRLLRSAEKSGLQRPHANINDLLQAGVLLPDNTGYYIWKS